MPFISCSPRSSNATPAEVRAIPLTTSDTRISPGADSPQIRDSDVHRPAVDVVVFADHVAGVQPDVQPQLRRRAQRQATPGPVDRLRRRRKRRQHPIPQQLPLNRRTARIPDRRAQAGVQSPGTISRNRASPSRSVSAVDCRDIREEDHRRGPRGRRDLTAASPPPSLVSPAVLSGTAGLQRLLQESVRFASRLESAARSRSASARQVHVHPPRSP